MMGSMLRTFRRALAKYGLLGTLYRIGNFVYWRIRNLMPAARRAARRAAKASREFDEKHGVRTGGRARLAQFEIPDETWIHGNYYEPVAPKMFRDLLAATNIADWSRYVFIDLGAGLGRAVLLASEYPFRKIVGVEFAPEMVAEAKQNLANFRNPSQVCPDLEMVLMDATEYPLPAEPTVLYLYNPFQVPLMEKVARRVSDSLRETPRDFLLLYLNPVHDSLWHNVPELEKLVHEGRFTIYRHRHK
jgi:SAM-dependent methyltransferase